MKQLTLTLDDATFASAEQQARKSGKSLPVLVMELVRRFAGVGESDFDRLVREEEAVRAEIFARGTHFSAEDRLPRDQLHDRHALR